MAETKKGPAESRYHELVPDREIFLNRARECAKLTIPALFPPGDRKNAKLKTAQAGLGARGVNNLASKLVLIRRSSCRPTLSSFFPAQGRGQHHRQGRGAEHQPRGRSLKTEIEKALAKVERVLLADVEINADRVVAFEMLKHLVVGGNALLHDGKTGLRLFHLDRYVCRRDPMGNAVEVVVHENISADVLPKDFYTKIKSRIPKVKGSETNETSRLLDIYTHLQRKQDKWEIYQEVCGLRVPGTFGTYPPDACPWIPLRLNRIAGEDYGRGYVEEYLGDLQSLEGLMKAIVDGSAAAAKVMILVDPNGMTRVKTIADSPNGVVAEGKAEDVSIVQLDKYADFRVAKDTVAMISERLSFAFLLNSSVQRNAERVTAEEVRYMAGELEDALGGVYSILAVEFQLPYVTQKMARLQKDGKVPPMPKGTVRPTIITGMEALGRGYDKNKLMGFLTALAEALGPQAVATYIEVPEAVKRLALADGIETGLGQDQRAHPKTQQQQLMAEMTNRLGPRPSSPLVANDGTNRLPPLNSRRTTVMADENTTAAEGTETCPAPPPTAGSCRGPQGCEQERAGQGRGTGP
jgi:hypothetical protein